MKKSTRHAKGGETDGSGLHRAIAARTARIGIIGLGYVGLPLACLFSEKGFPTTGFDIDAPKVTALNAGRSYILDVKTSDLAACVQAGRLRATTDPPVTSPRSCGRLAAFAPGRLVLRVRAALVRLARTRV